LRGQVSDSGSAWISTKASFENNGESHMKATP
jgi:hypothetical protein